MEKKNAADDLFLFLWIIGILVMQNSGIHSSAKYMIGTIPPVIAILLRYDFWERISKKTGKKAIILLTGLTFLMGFVTSAADYEAAGINRKIAAYCEKNLKTNDNNVWFLGHWGFQYYMEEKGFKAYYRFSSAPRKGDYLIVSSLAWPQEENPNLRVTLVDKVSSQGKFP